MNGSIKKQRTGNRGSLARGQEAFKRLFRTKKLAEQAIRAANDCNERRRRHGLPAEVESIILRELHDAFMAQYSGRAQSKTTLEYRLRPALARFGDDAVRQLNAAQIAAWYGTLDNTRTRRADTR
jgi:hypothetical protein